MRFLAEFIMRGRLQAIVVVVAAAAIPMLSWLAAAASSLVLLRRGLRDGLGVAVWALLPAVVWWLLGDPRGLLVILGGQLLALVLRGSVSWQAVLLCSVGLGGLYVLVIDQMFGQSIQLLVAEVQRLLPTALPEVWNGMDAQQQLQLMAVFASVMTGLIAALLQGLALLALMLGRYWQALLYNPGGFGREFRALRLSPPLAIMLLAVVLMAPGLGAPAALLMPLCSVPLVFASLALVHGLAARQQLARFWVVGLYVGLVLFLQFIYPLLAILAVVDSVFDFRGRAPQVQGEGPTDGEG